MSEYERIFKRVTEIEVNGRGLAVRWIGEYHEENEMVFGSILSKEFSIIKSFDGENAGLITVKIG